MVLEALKSHKLSKNMEPKNIIFLELLQIGHNVALCFLGYLEVCAKIIME